MPEQKAMAKGEEHNNMFQILHKVKQKKEDGSLREMALEAKWMYGFSRRYWLAVLYYICLGILSSVMGLVSGVASKNLIDAVTGGAADRLAVSAAVMAGMQLGSIGVAAASKRISNRITLKVNREIQSVIYGRIMETDWESLSGFPSGDIVNRFNRDIDTVAENVIGWIPSFITKGFQFVGTLGVILYYDPTLALFALISAPVTLVAARVLMKKMRYYNRSMRAMNSEMMAFHQESFFNIQQIKAFGLIPVFERRLNQVQQKYVDMAEGYNKTSVGASAFLSLIGMLTALGCFGWGTYRLWSGAITFGTMTLFLQLSSSLSVTFGALVNMVPGAIGAMTAAGRIMEISELPREREPDKKEMEAPELVCEDGLFVGMENLSFHYKSGDMVLEHGTFTAAPGEIIALVGPSGQGKTTTIRLLLGLLNPQEGCCYLKDLQGGRIEISAATRKYMSYVPQGNTVFSGTIAGNMRMVAPNASDEEIVEALKQACAWEFVRELPQGIYSTIQERGNDFSEGQNQRLSIARALLRKAPVILMDEATSALDVSTERRLLRNIMKKQEKQTCILTTHRPTVLALCDRVYQVGDGSICKLDEEKIQNYRMEF